MFEVVDTSLLNDVQRQLASEFFDDRIAPCLYKLLDSAKNTSTKEMLMQIILLSRQGCDKIESNVFFEGISKNTPKWPINILKNLFALYQEGNATHIFMACILDKRFHVPSAEEDLKRWQDRCITELLCIYTKKLDVALGEKYPELFQQEFKKVFSDIPDSIFIKQESPSYKL